MAALAGVAREENVSVASLPSQRPQSELLRCVRVVRGAGIFGGLGALWGSVNGIAPCRSLGPLHAAPCGIRLPSPAPWLAWSCPWAAARRNRGINGQEAKLLEGPPCAGRCNRERPKDPSTGVGGFLCLGDDEKGAGEKPLLLHIRDLGGGADRWGMLPCFVARGQAGRQLSAMQHHERIPAIPVAGFAGSHASPTAGWATLGG